MLGERIAVVGRLAARSAWFWGRWVPKMPGREETTIRATKGPMTPMPAVPPPRGLITRGHPLLFMRDDYIREALKRIDDPTILINVISRRVKQLKRGNRPLVESLEKLSPEDTALREVMEGKISYELPTAEMLTP